MILPFLLAIQPMGLAGAFTGFPGCTNPKSLPIAILSHSVTVNLSNNGCTSQSLTLLKNRGGSGGTIILRIPTFVRAAGTMGALQGLTFAASWDKVPLTLAPPFWGTSTNINALIDKDGVVLGNVVVKPYATHALRISWSGDVLIAGQDGKERLLTYDLGSVLDWRSPIGEYRYSIQYSGAPEPVFSVVSVSPSSGWELGPKGAFFRKSDLRPSQPQRQSFQYYPSNY